MGPKLSGIHRHQCRVIIQTRTIQSNKRWGTKICSGARTVALWTSLSNSWKSTLLLSASPASSPVPIGTPCSLKQRSSRTTCSPRVSSRNSRAGQSPILSPKPTPTCSCMPGVRSRTLHLKSTALWRPWMRSFQSERPSRITERNSNSKRNPWNSGKRLSSKDPPLPLASPPLC